MSGIWYRLLIKKFTGRPQGDFMAANSSGVFFYKRRFCVALTNSGFQRADVSTRVRFGEPVNP
jgi:hypothetical protein